MTTSSDSRLSTTFIPCLFALNSSKYERSRHINDTCSHLDYCISNLCNSIEISFKPIMPTCFPFKSILAKVKFYVLETTLISMHLTFKYIFSSSHLAYPILVLTMSHFTRETILIQSHLFLRNFALSLIEYSLENYCVTKGIGLS